MHAYVSERRTVELLSLSAAIKLSMMVEPAMKGRTKEQEREELIPSQMCNTMCNWRDLSKED